MHPPVISIVMPSLNQGEFLGQAVRSVLEQAPEAAELVVMDGGSTDGTLEQLAAFTAEFAGRLRWFSGPDGGPAQAVNAALREARAPLVGWLNSDDLYAPGTIARAIDHLNRHPEHVMVYGHGEHIDAAGQVLERYPSLPPETPLAAFADGCFICQPTAFFRRNAVMALGGLDESYRASFDFDLWMRLFRAHPQGVGFIDAVQAQSRLHAGGITLRFRERVALEGLRTIHTHLGPAPAHWLLTHFEELCASHPFLGEAEDLTSRFERVVQQGKAWLAPHALPQVRAFLAADRRAALASAHVFVGVHADGWARESGYVRVRQPQQPLRALRLHCTQDIPGGDGWSRIQVFAPDGQSFVTEVNGNGPFDLLLELGDRRADARLLFSLSFDGGFVPAELGVGSSDQRRLAFRVEGVEACE